MSDLLLLPRTPAKGLPILDKVTEALGVPRDVLATQSQIATAWTALPAILEKIPPQLRTAQHARLCVAVAAGLFDAAINYAWNSAVIALRQRIVDFGVHVVPQVLQKPFDRKILDDMKDSELLALCLALNLLDEDGHFFLGQSREVRNNFSSAHPPMGSLDEHELLAFVNRCAKYALSSEVNPQGVDVQGFIKALRGGPFNDTQLNKWVERLDRTHDAQRDVLFGTLHGIFCDPGSSQESRLNALKLCESFKERFSPSATSTLVNRHNDYTASGDEERHKASRDFFVQLQLLSVLSEAERHGMISRACDRLREVHSEFNNFYNEPAFAEHLADLSSQGATPDTAQEEYVFTVALCGTGNQYGVARAALPHYHRMVKNFSPREISLLLNLPSGDTVLARRLKTFPRCESRFAGLVVLVDEKSVPRSSLKTYEKWRVRGV